MRRLAALLLLAAAAGCDGQEVADTMPAEAVAPVRPSDPLPAGRSEAAPAAATPPVAADAPASILALDGEGLRFVDPQSGSTRLLAFGAPLPQALAALEPVRGAPAERAANPECGAGPQDVLSWPDGLQLRVQDDRFVGWSIPEGRGQAFSTMSGLAVGSTRRGLDAAYDAEVSESTLGQEFSAGGIAGLLSGSGPDARVTTLWAGVSCVFR